MSVRMEKWVGGSSQYGNKEWERRCLGAERNLNLNDREITPKQRDIS
jgi:hypothetical protein